IVLGKVNELRAKEDLPALNQQDDLHKAAQDHNTYLVSMDKLTHVQDDKSKRTVRDRVEYFGGKELLVGENIQFSGFSVMIHSNGDKTVITPTYNEVADQIVNNWTSSKEHYKKIANEIFVNVGTSIAYSSNKTGIFATQVYGSVTPKENKATFILEDTAGIPLSIGGNKINVDNINTFLLNSIVADKVNEIRKARNLNRLDRNITLTQAAADHNKYQQKQGYLTHSQKDKSKRTVRDRVASFGASLTSVGENVAFLGFPTRVQGDKVQVITPTYDEAADQIVNNWVRSDMHYKNMMNVEFAEIGTMVTYDTDKKGLFVTQVYSSAD
ncbi:MAG: CAP domain-containing protein, partial [Chitinophagales bacterium]